MKHLIMDIPWDNEGVFRSRPNRFLGNIDIPDLGIDQEKVHIHDPGRLEELLFPGNRVLLRNADAAILSVLIYCA